MLPPLHQKVLHTIAHRLVDQSLIWVVTGSCNFVLQGVEVAVNDIDLQTDSVGAYAIQQLFQEYVVTPVTYRESPHIRSHFGALEIDSTTVEIMGDIQKRLPDNTWDDPVNLSQHRRWVEVADMRIPVLSLEYEHYAYRLLGRTEKADMLHKWLSRQDSST